jgi:hypothetical protein
MLLRLFLAITLFASMSSGASSDSKSSLSKQKLSHIKSLFAARRKLYQYLHVLEFGPGNLAPDLCKHDAVVSWAVVSHDPIAASSARTTLEGESKVTVKNINGDFSMWTSDSYDRTTSEGTVAEFTDYINEIKFFGAKDK